MKTLEKILANCKKFIGKGILASALALPFATNAAYAQETQQNPKTQQKNIEKYDGFCYGPFRDNEDPDRGVFPTTEELNEDVAFLAKFTKRIRFYGCTSTQAELPRICDENNLECYVGAWLGKYNIENEKEIDILIKIAKSKFKSVKKLVVGNEVLLRKDIPKSEHKNFIKRVSESTDIPVGIAEVSDILLQNPDVAENCRFLLVHDYPFWNGHPIEGAAQIVINNYEKVKKAFPGKEIIIGETGWPSAGEPVGRAIPSPENQQKYFEEFIKLAKEKNIPYFYFEAFDESWKKKFEGERGAFWGSFNSDGTLKPSMKKFFNNDVANGIKRPARKLTAIPLTAPFVVYDEAGAEENHFEPTGWMGDLESLATQRDCTISPGSGKTCTKIEYRPEKCRQKGWAGIYWQYPINNWGDYPGYTVLKGCSKLEFMARGEKGGEEAEFKVGGINRSPYHNAAKNYEDSFGPLTTGVVKLEKEWKTYEINLKGKDLSSVIGGFCFVTNNRKGCTIYLDAIKFK